MRAAAYIDGFNLYYGLRALRERAPQFGENRWLDLRRLAQELAPGAGFGSLGCEGRPYLLPAPRSLLPAPRSLLPPPTPCYPPSRRAA